MAAALASAFTPTSASLPQPMTSVGRGGSAIHEVDVFPHEAEPADDRGHPGLPVHQVGAEAQVDVDGEPGHVVPGRRVVDETDDLVPAEERRWYLPCAAGR